MKSHLLLDHCELFFPLPKATSERRVWRHSGVFHGVERLTHHRLKSQCSFSPCCFILLFSPPSLYLGLNQRDSFSPPDLFLPSCSLLHLFAFHLHPNHHLLLRSPPREQSRACPGSRQRWAGITSDSGQCMKDNKQQNGYSQIIDFMCG